MTRPSWADYLFGNPISAIVLLLGTPYFGYVWLSERGSGWIFLGFVIATSYAWKASERVNRFSRWKREWDTMAEKSPRARPLRFPNMRYVLGVIAWLFLALLALGSAGDPAMRAPVMLFWLASVVIVIGGIYRAMNSGRGPKGSSVQICLPQARNSPPVARCREQLPAHCRQLFT